MSVVIERGHVVDVLAREAAGRYHLVCTSPPFYGLRDYGTPPQVWLPPAHEAPCAPGEHEWGALPRVRLRGQAAGETAQAGNTKARVCPPEQGRGSVCARCGAWSGELGQEPLPDCLAWARNEPPCAVCYVCHLRTVFGGRERPEGVWRVLRDDGVVLLNLGDSYSTHAAGKVDDPMRTSTLAGIGTQAVAREHKANQPYRLNRDIPEKNLLAIPWRVGLALQADGWTLRNDVIWAKKNGMPESVTDRCTRSHEYVLHLAKSPRYFWDAEGIREEAVALENRGRARKLQQLVPSDGARNDDFGARWQPTGGKNARSVWWFATQPLKDAHYAPFPDELPERAILAGTSERGCCLACGAPWTRIIERPTPPPEVFTKRAAPEDGFVYSGSRVEGEWKGHGQKLQNWRDEHPVRTVGWEQACACPPAEPVPCRVLDPFGGSGTTGVVANRLGRDATLIELRGEYADLARRRVVKEPLSLFALTPGEGEGWQRSEPVEYAERVEPTEQPQQTPTAPAAAPGGPA